MNTLPLFIKPFENRPVGRGIQTLGASARLDFPGTNSQQKRYQLIVTNLDAALQIYVCMADGGSTVFLPVFPSTSVTIISCADFRIVNPNGGAAVDCCVGELFYDEGYSDGYPVGVGGVPGPGGGGGTFAGGGPGQGGSWGGGSGAGTFGGGSGAGTGTKVN